MLITYVLKYFEQKYEKQAVYLHTQPESYQAIKLYKGRKADSFGDPSRRQWKTAHESGPY